MKSPWRSPLYAILDLPHAGGLGLLDAGRGLLNGGSGVLQLRAKGGFDAVEFDDVLELAGLAHARGVPLIINDDMELARRLLTELGQDTLVGAHLGQEDLLALREGDATVQPDGYWGLSTHDLDQVGRSGRLSAFYLGFGPVFATQTKAKAEPVTGLELLGRACRSTVSPVVAIGGVTAERGTDCLEAGATAVACVSALVADSPVRIEARCGEMLSHLMMR